MWNPTALIKWQAYCQAERMRESLYKWLSTNPTLAWRNFAAEYEPRYRLIRRCSSSLVRMFRRGY